MSTCHWSTWSLSHASSANWNLRCTPSCWLPDWKTLSAAPVLVWSRPSWCQPWIWRPSSLSCILLPRRRQRSKAVFSWLLCTAESVLRVSSLFLPVSQHPSLPPPRRCLHPSGQLQSGFSRGSSDNPVYHTHPERENRQTCQTIRYRTHLPVKSQQTEVQLASLFNIEIHLWSLST